MSNFRPVDRDTGFLMPPSVDEWLPQKHLARFVVDVIASLDLRAMIGSYRGSGEASYHPTILLGILIQGYATGVFSSRKLERATYDQVALRFIAANQHPDHDTIAAFRRRFLKQIGTVFVQVLMLAREMGVLKLGTLALAGTKLHANASRHSALSYERAGQIETQLQAEVAGLMARAEAADQADAPDGMSSPEGTGPKELAPKNWRGVSTAWRRSPAHGPSSGHAPRSGMSASRPSTKPRWRHARRRRRRAGKLYALRKHTPEREFGIIKSALEFRQFLLRGLENVRGEWNLVTMSWNLRRVFVLAGAN